jgi:UDPglucose 6-dehydrogenase
MKVGVIGLGKLGLPVALAIESKGHEVCGYDVNPAVKGYLEQRKIPFKEEGLQPLLDNHKIKLEAGVDEVVANSDIVFLAIQTPHEPQFEGDKRIPDERADFDYSYLKKAVTDVADAAEWQEKHVTLVVISTCLPGTFKREIEPLLNQYVHYVYNPFFIAMGTVLQDFLNPEFVLVGKHEGDFTGLLSFYASIHDRPCFTTDITTAEGIKVFYNTFITMKTVLANTYGEMAHKLGMNVDDIYQALSMATDRIISPKYLQAGMGDGGGCHPRDNIALSYIAKKVNLSHNIFEDLMKARESHAEWLADQIVLHAQGRPVVLLGRAFKPETNIETGSPAILVANILKEEGISFEHLENATLGTLMDPHLYFIGTKHQRYSQLRFPYGSVVIDPFGYIPDQSGVEVVRIGRP